MVDIRGEKDDKLQRLISLLDEKIENPFNRDNKKGRLSLPLLPIQPTTSMKIFTGIYGKSHG
ncbi:MAG: hypothetical protein U5L96_11830 [Owenweeksia sp.]|nr:hypothetical protein [Owenweeksia sp.]